MVLSPYLKSILLCMARVLIHSVIFFVLFPFNRLRGGIISNCCISNIFHLHIFISKRDFNFFNLLLTRLYLFLFRGHLVDVFQTQLHQFFSWKSRNKRFASNNARFPGNFSLVTTRYASLSKGLFD